MRTLDVAGTIPPEARESGGVDGTFVQAYSVSQGELFDVDVLRADVLAGVWASTKWIRTAAKLGAAIRFAQQGDIVVMLEGQDARWVNPLEAALIMVWMASQDEEVAHALGMRMECYLYRRKVLNAVLDSVQKQGFLLGTIAAWMVKAGHAKDPAYPVDPIEVPYQDDC